MLNCDKTDTTALRKDQILKMYVIESDNARP